MLLNAVNLIYSQSIAEDKRRPRKPRHYPSSACAVLQGKFTGKCRRATWYEWEGADRTDPPDAAALFKMATGNLIHEQLSGLLERALLAQGYTEEMFHGEGLGDELEEAGPDGNMGSVLWPFPGLLYPMSGRMDKRFVSPEGVRVSAEWKSTYGRGADDVKANGPKPEALLQSYLYLRQERFPLDATILLYACRDLGYLYGFWVTLCDGGMKAESMNSSKVQIIPISDADISAPTAELEGFIGGDAPPLRDYEQGKGWQCGYCSFKKLCWGGS